MPPPPPPPLLLGRLLLFDAGVVVLFADFNIEVLPVELTPPMAPVELPAVALPLAVAAVRDMLGKRWDDNPLLGRAKLEAHSCCIIAASRQAPASPNSL